MSKSESVPRKSSCGGKFRRISGPVREASHPSACGPLKTWAENAWGILSIESAISEARAIDPVSIAKTKLRGFVKANRIKFPIFIDECHVFRQSERKGSSVVLFDGANNILKEYMFPLNKDQTAEILRILSGF